MIVYLVVMTASGSHSHVTSAFVNKDDACAEAQRLETHLNEHRLFTYRVQSVYVEEASNKEKVK
ncbi:MAG: hypothetical protein ACK5LP_07180 [Campylobacteraceae bacterium]